MMVHWLHSNLVLYTSFPRPQNDHDMLAKPDHSSQIRSSEPTISRSPQALNSALVVLETLQDESGCVPVVSDSAIVSDSNVCTCCIIFNAATCSSVIFHTHSLCSKVCGKI